MVSYAAPLTLENSRVGWVKIFIVNPTRFDCYAG
jgi:hypothetical protein